MTIQLERPIVLICQCVPACFHPALPADHQPGDAVPGCMLPSGHEGDHSPDGPGDFTYVEGRTAGPRVVLREAAPLWYDGQCPRCKRVYTVDVRYSGQQQESPFPAEPERVVPA